MRGAQPQGEQQRPAHRPGAVHGGSTRSRPVWVRPAPHHVSPAGHGALAPPTSRSGAGPPAAAATWVSPWRAGGQAARTGRGRRRCGRLPRGPPLPTRRFPSQVPAAFCLGGPVGFPPRRGAGRGGPGGCCALGVRGGASCSSRTNYNSQGASRGEGATGGGGSSAQPQDGRPPPQPSAAAP